jgi:hypothetical protein
MQSARMCFALAAMLLLPAPEPGAQESPKRFRGAILVQAVDTAINPIPAEIILPAFEVSTRVNDDGLALFVNVPDGLYLLQARYLGYRPEWRFVRVTGDTSRLEMVLAPADIRNGVVRGGVAESRLREFLRRTTSIPLGSFVTRGEINRRRPRNLLALLDRIPDVMIDRSVAGPPVVRSERVRGPQCSAGMLFFVDATLPTGSSVPGLADIAEHPTEARLMRGMRRERRLAGLASRWDGGQAPGAASYFDAPSEASIRREASPGGRRLMSVMERLPVHRIAAVEVYPTLAGVPPEFRVMGAECGVVLVWTG